MLRVLVTVGEAVDVTVVEGLTEALDVIELVVVGLVDNDGVIEGVGEGLALG
jgi:hypothetical protein